MATLYVTYAASEEGQTGDHIEKIAIAGTDAVGTQVTTAQRGVIIFHTDTVCQVAVAAKVTPATASDKPFYVYPGIQKCVKVGVGCRVVVKTA